MNGDERTTLALFGGSGATGQEIIAQAVERGVRIKGLVREGSSLGEHGEHVLQITGSLDDPEALDRTLDQSDVVSIVFGPRPPYTDVFCAAGTEAILEAMRRKGIRRLVCQTGAMIGEYPENQSLPFRLMAQLYRWRNPEGAADRAEQERLIRESGLDWTLVKPPRLTNRPRSERFLAGPELKVGLLSSVSRADVAAFTLSEILAPRNGGKVVFLRS